MGRADGRRRGEEKMRLVPRGEKKCIWMAAGVLSYKLCNRGFNCDACPLDMVLQSMDDLDSPNVQRVLSPESTDLHINVH